MSTGCYLRVSPMPSPHPSWSSVSPVPISGARAVRLSLGTKLAVATVGVLAIASTLLFWELTARERRGLVAAKTQELEDYNIRVHPWETDRYLATY